MFSFLSRLLGKNYEPLNRIKISKNSLLHNLKYLQGIDSKIKIAPVLKSNAYGHGIVQIAKLLDDSNCPFFCVDGLHEAYILKRVGIKTPILIMGYINPPSLDTRPLPFSLAVFSIEQAKQIAKYQPRAKIHIFVDTGMHREGVTPNNLEGLLSYVKNETSLVIEGLMSHLAMAFHPNDPRTQKQFVEFEKAITICKKEGINPKYTHILNSSGILNKNKFKKEKGNIARAAISLYGIDLEGKDKNLRPVLSLSTHIADIKELKKGEGSGYDLTYKTNKDTKIAILPIGYNDGVDRRLSNKGVVKINNKYYPIIGIVSMNICVIEIGNNNNIKVGQEVEIFSANSKDPNSIYNAAIICNTNPCELLTHHDASTRRVVI